MKELIDTVGVNRRLMIRTYSFMTVLMIEGEPRFCRVFPGLRRVDVMGDDGNFHKSLEIKSTEEIAFTFAEAMANASFYDLQPMKF